MNETFKYCFIELFKDISCIDDRIELAKSFTDILYLNRYDYEELQTILMYMKVVYEEHNYIIYNIEEFLKNI